MLTKTLCRSSEISLEMMKNTPLNANYDKFDFGKVLRILENLR